MTVTNLVRMLALSALLLTGVGCMPYAAPKYTAPAPVAIAPAPQLESAAADPYEGWGEIQPGGIVSLRIPPGCYGDPGAGSIYVICPTAEQPEPIPEFVASSDGIQVNIRRWEGLEVAHWDEIIASIRVLAPLDRAVQINIEK